MATPDRRHNELGYADGYADPEVDRQPPVAVELMDVFREGELAGRDDRRSEVAFGPPAPDNVGPSIPPDGEADQHAVETMHVLLDVGVHVGLERMFEAAGGLIALVLTALQVPADTPMRAPDPVGSHQPTAGGRPTSRSARTSIWT
jgi:hypothetical protein